MNRNNKKQAAWLAYMIANVTLHGWHPYKMIAKSNDHGLWGIADNDGSGDRLQAWGPPGHPSVVVKTSGAATSQLRRCEWEDMPIAYQRKLLAKWREFYEGEQTESIVPLF